MNFVYLLIVALLGSIVFGILSVRHAGGVAEMVLATVGALFPLCVGAGLWVYQQVARRNGDLFGTSSDGDVIVLVVGVASFLLLPVSCGLVLLVRKLGRQAM